MQERVSIRPGTLVVFEGLDGTGKSTQMQRIKERKGTLFADPTPFFTHQPSGGTSLGQYVYQITENVQIASPLARQHLHLASHAEHWQVVLSRELRRTSVWMDRFWWSTMAYGFYNSEVLRGSNWVGEQDFETMCQEPMMLAGVERLADVLFLFDDPHVEDDHNTETVALGYETMFQRWNGIHPVVKVPKDSVANTTLFIFNALVDLDLADCKISMEDIWKEEEA